METSPSLLTTMDAFLGPVAPGTTERLRAVSADEMGERVASLALSAEATREITEYWPQFVRDDQWMRLLAQLVAMVERGRGHLEEPLPIWDDADAYGPSGRLLYFYVFALTWSETADFLRAQGMPDDVVDTTLSALARHAETHRLKWGTVGVDAGWWMLLLLRGELVQIGSLKFHQVRLGQGVLSPKPWFTPDEQAQRGEGFREGDMSLGIHIPARIDLSPEALDRTFARAREVLSVAWPPSTRRLATCESWMMDDRLVEALGPSSRVVGFQQRFTLLPRWHDDRDNVLEFVFRQPGVPFEQLRATSRLQEFILRTLAQGPWHNRIGWLDFDGPRC